MFRVHQYLQELKAPTPLGPKVSPSGPVVIWNLIRRCNLACKHCYTNSYDEDFKDELSTAEVFKVMDDLWDAGVRVLILSGGEPLLRPDIFDLSHRAKQKGFYVGLSSNGTRINAQNINDIVAVGFNYVGVSLDGIGATNDLFRRKVGAFDEALNGIRTAIAHGIKVGLRFTLTQETAQDLPSILSFLETERLDKFYLSHLNYSGRGRVNRKTDAHFAMTREAMDLLFEEAWRCLEAGVHREFVTGNNDADGVYLLQWAQKRFPERVPHLRAKLAQWGGNSTGVNIANIDNTGVVHPDSFWWSYGLGNVRARHFGDIWADVSDPLMKGLKAKPRVIGGRCGQCTFFDVCGGNTRVRAYEATKNFWAEDPGCYLTDEELGIPMAVTPAEAESGARPTAAS